MYFIKKKLVKRGRAEEEKKSRKKKKKEIRNKRRTKVFSFNAHRFQMNVKKNVQKKKRSASDDLADACSDASAPLEGATSQHFNMKPSLTTKYSNRGIRTRTRPTEELTPPTDHSTWMEGGGANSPQPLVGEAWPPAPRPGDPVRASAASAPPWP